MKNKIQWGIYTNHAENSNNQILKNGKQQNSVEKRSLYDYNVYQVYKDITVTHLGITRYISRPTLILFLF